MINMYDLENNPTTLSLESTTPTLQMNDTADETFPHMERVIFSAFLITTSLLGICGNSLTILSFLFSRKLRSATYEFIFNLSCADLITSLIIPLDVVALLMDGWPFPAWICSTAAAILFVCIGCSLFTLASISIERLVVVTRKQYVSRKFCSRPFRLLIYSTWVLPFALLVLPPIFDIGGLGYDMMYHSCAAKSDHPKSDIYNMITTMTMSFPLLVAVISYAIIFISVRRQSRKTLKTFTSSQESLVTTSTLQQQSIAMNNFNISMESMVLANAVGNHALEARLNLTAHLRRRQILLAKHTSYVMFAFLFCVAPYAVSVAIPNSNVILPYAAALLLLNSAINPIIYTRHPNFRKIFVLIIKGKWSDIPKPTRFLKCFID